MSLGEFPPKRLRYDVRKEREWTPPPSSPKAPYVFRKRETDDLSTDAGWMA